MRQDEYFVVVEGRRIRGGRISWEYAYMAKGRRAAKAALKDPLVRVFAVNDEGNLLRLRP